MEYTLNCKFQDCEKSFSNKSKPAVLELFKSHLLGHQAAVATLQQQRGGASTSVNGQAEKVKRPELGKEITNEQWEYFRHRWTGYKSAFNLTGEPLKRQLLECCSGDLRRDIYRQSGGDPGNNSEEDILLTLKTLAIHEENIMVSHVRLSAIRQDRDEQVNTFVTRLRGQAAICAYNGQPPTCPNCHNDQPKYDYSEVMIRDALCRGLADADIQQEVLGHENQNMSLAEAIKLISAK